MSKAPAYIRLPVSKSLNYAQRREVEGLLIEHARDSSEWTRDAVEIVEGSGQTWWYSGEYSQDEGFRLDHYGISIPA